MANRYGEAALMAARMETFGKALAPLERWQDAMGRLYPTTPAAQRRGGPRGAFVGLCEAGLVVGVRPGSPSGANRNKDYAVEAVRLLRAGTHTKVSQLWAEIAGENAAPHSSQMDVVLALWKNGLIVPE